MNNLKTQNIKHTTSNQLSPPLSEPSTLTNTPPPKQHQGPIGFKPIAPMRTAAVQMGRPQSPSLRAEWTWCQAVHAGREASWSPRLNTPMNLLASPETQPRARLLLSPPFPLSLTYPPIPHLSSLNCLFFLKKYTNTHTYSSHTHTHTRAHTYSSHTHTQYEKKITARKKMK